MRVRSSSGSLAVSEDHHFEAVFTQCQKPERTIAISRDAAPDLRQTGVNQVKAVVSVIRDDHIRFQREDVLFQSVQVIQYRIAGNSCIDDLDRPLRVEPLAYHIL